MWPDNDWQEYYSEFNKYNHDAKESEIKHIQTSAPTEPNSFDEIDVVMEAMELIK